MCVRFLWFDHKQGNELRRKVECQEEEEETREDEGFRGSPKQWS